METKDIKILLDKYWEGETNQSEEKQLHNYFSNTVVADDLKEYQVYFQSINQLSEQELPADFNDKVLAAIEPKAKPMRFLTFKNLMAAASVAAVLTVASIFYQPNNSGAALSQAEKQQAQQAYNETLLALQMISTKLDKGNQSISKIGVWHQVQQKIANN